MIDKTIKIACQGATTLKLEQLNILQKDLKSLSHDDYEKYKSEIINTGYAFPIKAWKDPENKWWIVGGTQSFRVLTEMSNEGWNIPEIPISVINAKDKKEAMRRVLQDASSYGKMESDGLYEFLQLAEMNIEDFNKSFRTPEIDHEQFKDEFFEQITGDDDTEDNVPEVKESFVKLGDLWRLGDHRLLCGDSTDPILVSNLIGQDKIDMVFTDPPYGMNLDTEYMASFGDYHLGRTKRDYRPVKNDDKPFDFEKSYSLVKDIKEQIWFGADYFCQMLPQNGSWFVFNKRTSENLGKMYGNHFELFWSKVKHQREIANITWAGFLGHSKKDDGIEKTHPTMKPIKLIEWVFERIKGQSVIDLFGGSGSTLIACEKTKRKCYMMELDPHYCGVIIERWQQYTGKKAEKIN